jgi:tRNA(adenine34) deaminase
MQATAADQSLRVSRRHLVAGALGAIALPATIPAFARGIDGPATKQDVAFMRIALEEAALGDFPFGAVIVRDGGVLARGRISAFKNRTPRRMARWWRSGDSLPRMGPKS